MQYQKSNNNLLSKYRGALMGISILLIMLFHYTEDCQIYEVHYTGWIRWFRTYIGSSSVDAFLFLSGLGLYYSMKKNPDVDIFYRRRVARLMIPYVIVALPSWIILDVFIKKSGLWKALRDFTFLSFFRSGVKWYWYVGFMLFCYLIYPYVFQIVDSARDVIDGEIRLISLISAITVFILVFMSAEKDIFSNTNIALLRFPAFLAGCFYGRSSYEERKSYWKWGILLILSTVLLMLLPSNSSIFRRYVQGMFNISSCAAIAWLFSKVSIRPFLKVLEWFGAHSLELYLSHVTIRKLMCDLGYPTYDVHNEILMLVTSIVLAWLLQILVNQLQKQRKQVHV